MVGQKHLFENLRKYSIDNFPHALMLIGDFGCGKHTFVKYMSDYLNIKSIDITCNLNLSLLDEITIGTIPHIYLIDGSEITLKEQNIILKFLEEPRENCFIVIIGENKAQFLPTILNRCQIWNFQNYSIEELREFNNFEDINVDILKLAKTPGRLKILKDYPLTEADVLSNKIIDKLKVANIANALTLYDKIPLITVDTKIYFRLFVDILIKNLTYRIIENKDDSYYLWYYKIIDLRKKSNMPKIDIKYLFENFVSDMWQEVNK